MVVADRRLGEETSVEDDRGDDVGQTARDSITGAVHGIAAGVDIPNVADRGGDAGKVEEHPRAEFAVVVEYGGAEE